MNPLLFFGSKEAFDHNKIIELNKKLHVYRFLQTAPYQKIIIDLMLNP
jgi:hypothetical protein